MTNQRPGQQLVVGTLHPSASLQPHWPGRMLAQILHDEVVNTNYLKNRETSFKRYFLKIFCKSYNVINFSFQPRPASGAWPWLCLCQGRWRLLHWGDSTSSDQVIIDGFIQWYIHSDAHHGEGNTVRWEACKWDNQTTHEKYKCNKFKIFCKTRLIKVVIVIKSDKIIILVT